MIEKTVACMYVGIIAFAASWQSPVAENSHEFHEITQQPILLFEGQSRNQKIIIL